MTYMNEMDERRHAFKIVDRAEPADAHLHAQREQVWKAHRRCLCPKSEGLFLLSLVHVVHRCQCLMPQRLVWLSFRQQAV